MPQEYWFNSEMGIKAYYAEQREQAAADALRVMTRINTEECDMLAALKETSNDQD